MSKFAITQVVLSGALLSSAAQAAYVYNSIQNWGGGYVPGVTFNSAGQAYIRTDVGGAYLWDATASEWIPLNDSFTNGNDMGSIALAVDITDDKNVYTTGGLYTDVIWCSEGSVFRSTDGGVSWTKYPLNSKTVSGTASAKLTSNGSICLGGNGEGRGMGNRLAVKGATLYLGTNQNGLLKSTDNGQSWTTIASFSNTDGISAVAFDSKGNIYAAPYAGGLYKSTDGSTFTQVAPTFTKTIYQMSVAGDVIWITSNDTKPLDQGTSSGGHVHKFTISTGAIQELSMPASCGGKSVGFVGVSSIGDGSTAAVSTANCWGGNGGPSSSNFVPHEYIYYTKDGGSTWSEIMRNGSFDAASAHSNATSNPHWVSALGINPTDPDNVIFGTGYGIWSTTNATAAKPTWKFTDKGIEETVPLGYVSTTKGAPLVSVVGDIDGYYHTDLDSPMETRHQIEAGTNYDIDYAGLMPEKMIRIYKEATKGLGAVSTDGGKTWKQFTTNQSALPTWTVNPYAGSSTYTNEDNFAAISADGSTIVWNMASNGVYYSTNDGASWAKASGITSSDVSGFHVVSDKKAEKTFYIYSASAGKLFKSTDGGNNWTAANSNMATMGDYAYSKARIFANPNAEGDLWAVQGVNGGGIWTNTSAPGVYHSTDGGSTFTKIDSLDYAAYIGFGKGKGSSPAIYAVGMAKTSNPVNSIYRSDDNGTTWTDIGDVNHRFGELTMVVGDPCIYSRIYLAGSGRGMIYAQEPGNTNTCPDRIDYNSSTDSPDGSSSSANTSAESSSSGTIVSSNSAATSSNSTVVSSSSTNGSSNSNNTGISSNSNNTNVSSNGNSNGNNNSENDPAGFAAPAIAQNIYFTVECGAITATFNAITVGHTTVSLMNSLGQVIASKNVNFTRGANSVSLETSYQGTAFLVIRQGSQKLIKTVRLK